MFNLFKKDPMKKLEMEYKALLEASYKLSTIDRKASDLKREEAEVVAKRMDELMKQK